MSKYYLYGHAVLDFSIRKMPGFRLSRQFYFMTVIVFGFCESKILTETDLEVVTTLVKDLTVRHLVILNNETESYSPGIVKTLSKDRIFSNFMNVEKMRVSIADPEERLFWQKTLVVLTGKNISGVLDEFFKVAYEGLVSRLIWSVFSSVPVTGKLNSRQNSLYIPYNCQILVINPLPNSSYKIIEIYHSSVQSHSLHSVHFGVWSKGSLIKLRSDFYERRFDLNEIDMGVAVGFRPDRSSHPALSVYHEMVMDLARVMHFRPVFRWWEDLLAENNTTFLSEIYLEQYVFDSTEYDKTMVAPIWKTPAFLHIRFDMSYEEGQSSPYFRPLTYYVWAAILIWIFVSSSCLICIELFTYMVFQYYKRFSFTEIGFRALDSFTNQSGSEIRHNISSRIAAIMTRAVPAIVVPAYSAAIVSFMTIKIVHLPFLGLLSLAEDGTFKIGYNNGSVIEDFFQDAKEKNDTRVGESLKFLLPPERLPMNITEACRWMCRDKKLSYIAFNNDVYLSQPKCRILQIPTPIFVTWDGFDLRDNSPYSKVFNRILKTFFSSGMVSRWGKFVYGTMPEKYASPSGARSHVSLELEAVLPLFEMIVVAYCVAVVTLCLEKLFIGMKLSNKRLDPLRLKFTAE